jgi:hypothetical protein
VEYYHCQAQESMEYFEKMKRLNFPAFAGCDSAHLSSIPAKTLFDFEPFNLAGSAVEVRLILGGDSALGRQFSLGFASLALRR